MSPSLAAVAVATAAKRGHFNRVHQGTFSWSSDNQSNSSCASRRFGPKLTPSFWKKGARLSAQERNQFDSFYYSSHQQIADKISPQGLLFPQNTGIISALRQL
jgi:hypothetical protein